MTNGKVRVLVADDEPLARERLRTLLAPVDWLEAWNRTWSFSTCR